MNIAHSMFILPRDPMFVLPRLGSFKLLQDHSITPSTIAKLLLQDEIEVFGSSVKQSLNSFTRLFKFYSSNRQRGEIVRWALSTTILLCRCQNNEAASCFFGGWSGAMLKAQHSTELNCHITGLFYRPCSFCPYVHSAPVSPIHALKHNISILVYI